MIKLKINGIILFLVVLLFNFSGCNYSFTGASVPAHLKTVAIPMFEDRSGSGIYRLKEDLTAVLTQKFVEDNSLLVSDKNNANCVVEGIISSAADTPSQISGGETIKSNRFTIIVKIVFRDLINKKIIFEKTFTGYKDYSAQGDITKGRQDAIAETVKLISEDILLGVVSNW